MYMTQQEIWDILKKNYPKYLTCVEIGEILNVLPQKLTTCLRSLRKYKEVEVTNVKLHYYKKFKRSCKAYRVKK